MPRWLLNLTLRIMIYGTLLGIILFGYYTMFHFKRTAQPAPYTKQIHHALDILEEQLKKHIQSLAGDIGERNVFHPDKLSEASLYIQKFWQEQGFHTQYQDYITENIPCKNLWVQIDGKTLPNETVIIGAHYDSVWTSPGANDNASGIAALLEISRTLKNMQPRRSIILIAFVNEEPPFFLTDQMGSSVFAKEMAKQGKIISSMIALETIGYFTNEENSQQYPPLIGWFYPSKGNFLAVVGNLKSRKLVKKVAKYFQASIDFPIEIISAPRNLPGIDWSDHASFWEHGYQAVMVTDTAPYRYPHYHQASDLPDKITYPAYTKVVYGLIEVVKQLANESQ